ncbi:UDP-glycosyltransferase 91C1-like [Cryptomeria japonica]|uniref:UDP-glycosyltransferase 91C1-like n=1 Tax=Cryptomeria japonica TaxID=3369 RepID=UPI0027DA2627|nr:UDP-glycosyltransferase 91C1-like [Cryptomeria japonica]
MAAEKQRALRVVMFPWLAYGHMTPFLELAKRLTAHGLKIFFVSTPLNIQRIKPQMWDAPGIDLVGLAMPSVEGLPAGVESTADCIGKEGGGGGLIPLLVQALDLLEKPFEALLRHLSPDFVVHDFVQYWVPRVASKLSIPIPTILFLALGAASISFAEGQFARGMENPSAEELTVAPPGFPSSIVGRRLFEARKVVALYRKQGEGISFRERGSICGRESWAVACNTCMELEGIYVEYLQAVTRRPVVPVGFLMPKLSPPPDDDICLQWLDRQPAASVVLVSFGSECTLTVDEIAAMAMGLQESGASFLWILPAGNSLPQGFQDQIGEKGLLVTKWVPQLHILNHPSTGAFLTHCGWNSITEGLRFGVPFIALPMQFEQGLNARRAQELNVGVEVRRNEDNGSFKKDDINKAIKDIMVEGGGVKIKYNVKKISNMLTDHNLQVSQRNIGNFVSMLRKFNK